jgi:hypothetical protein
VTSQPAALTNTTTAHFAFSAPGADSLEYSLDSLAWQATATTLDLSSLADGTHTLDVRSVLGSQTGTVTSVSWTVDTTPPSIGITSEPPASTNQTTAHVAFTVDDPEATVTCQLDAQAPVACTGSYDVSGLADGSHTITVVATDQAGNSASSSLTWTVNTSAPGVTFTTTPSAVTRQKSANFAWTVTDPTATVTCALDGNTPTSCSGNTSRNNLADGTHTFTVTAVDSSGNVGQADYIWTVDTVAPVITVLSAPPTTLIGGATATVTFSIDDPSATVTCQLDSNAPVACSGSYTVANPALSSHSIKIVATDPAGNSSQTTVSWTQIL